MRKTCKTERAAQIEFGKLFERTAVGCQPDSDVTVAQLLGPEHRWAVPLRDAIARAGGFRLSDGFISPVDLVVIGLTSAEEVRELHVMETAAAARL